MNKQINNTFNNIKKLKIQGATAVAMAVISSLRKCGLSSKTNNLKNWQQELKKSANFLISARPTEPLAQNSVKFIIKSVEKNKINNVVEAKDCLDIACDKIILLISDAGKKIIPFGRKIIKDGDDVLTHCHSWLAIQTIIDAHKNGRKIKVFNTETRPLFQGRETSKDFLKAHLNTTMVTDSSAGFLISRYSGKYLAMEKIVIGADAILADGSVINKIGSHAISAAAYLEKSPLYVVAPLLKFYHHSWIKIERRSPKEVWPSAPKNLKIINFAFDLIPADWITGIICEVGIVKPKDIKKYVRKLYPEIL
ncbi:MAG: translation initiation factor eIF-2B [Patescibacteria group bacterium]|nr:translation initiation factor eIF-2B [Patescibacteria group bacterium]MDD5121534.1 translation initiation factor eIF-2B [Patescibacteria group bacterium]MDD5222104.1 translation initiation factor eIF-2B [Patescibacteria group bacterium]MDD5396302.1 translation initiation factor eIF-2B [Patescibacteria group bacterium]